MLTFKNDELIKKVNAAIENVNGFDKYECEYVHLGIRFEDKDRPIGEEITDCSKDNEGRDDEREFPDYDSDEYADMPELDGISTWDARFWEHLNISGFSDSSSFDCRHIYLIGGDQGYDGPDDDEIVIQDGTVLAVIA